MIEIGDALYCPNCKCWFKARCENGWCPACLTQGSMSNEAQTHCVELATNELELLWSMMNERIIAARNHGIADDDSSSVFRVALFNKLHNAWREEMRRRRQA